MALLAAATLLSSVGVLGAGRAHAAPGEATQFVVQKVDAITGNPLADAHFTFYDHPGVQIGSCVTDATGFCHIDGTTNFSYKVEETTPPPGYSGQPGIVTAPVLTNPTGNPPLVFRDQKTGTPLQKVFVKKVDASTDAPLADAIFKLVGFVGAVEICFTDAAGTCSVDNVPEGKYEWKELSAPSGYDLNQATSPITVTAGVTPAVVTVKDQQTGQPPTSTLTVKKVDATTSAVLAGATFTLTGSTKTCTTDAQGLCSITGLSTGTYSWHETAAPAGYVIAADSAAIQITAATAGTTFAPTVVEDARARTALSVKKVDAGDPSHTLAGATFNLISVDSSATVGSCTTAAATGSCTVSNLPFGTYRWVEVSAPAGYDLPANPRSGAIDVDASNAGTAMAATVFADKASQSTLTLKKVDAADPTSALAGATYQLYRESNGVAGLQATGVSPSGLDSQSGQCMTAADGTCSIDGLPAGTYYWLETKAPTGYALSAAPSDAVVVDQSSAKMSTVSDAKLPTTPVTPATPGRPRTPGTPVTPELNQPGGPLAFTGFSALPIVGTATVLLVAGGLLLLVTSRRRRTAD